MKKSIFAAMIAISSMTTFAGCASQASVEQPQQPVYTQAQVDAIVKTLDNKITALERKVDMNANDVEVKHPNYNELNPIIIEQIELYLNSDYQGSERHPGVDYSAPAY